MLKSRNVTSSQTLLDQHSTSVEINMSQAFIAAGLVLLNYVDQRFIIQYLYCSQMLGCYSSAMLRNSEQTYYLEENSNIETLRLVLFKRLFIIVIIA